MSNCDFRVNSRAPLLNRAGREVRKVSRDSHVSHDTEKRLHFVILLHCSCCCPFPTTAQDIIKTVLKRGNKSRSASKSPAPHSQLLPSWQFATTLLMCSDTSTDVARHTDVKRRQRRGANCTACQLVLQIKHGGVN